MKNGHLKIDRGVPIPTKRRGGGRGFRAVLMQMKAGDSVVLPCKAYSNAWTAAHNALGRGKFLIRKDDGSNGFRVWRTK